MLDRQAADWWVQDKFDERAVSQLVVLHCGEEIGEERVVLIEHALSLVLIRGLFETRRGGIGVQGGSRVRRSSSIILCCFKARAVAMNEFVKWVRRGLHLISHCALWGPVV